MKNKKKIIPLIFLLLVSNVAYAAGFECSAQGNFQDPLSATSMRVNLNMKRINDNILKQEEYLAGTTVFASSRVVIKEGYKYVPGEDTIISLVLGIDKPPCDWVKSKATEQDFQSATKESFLQLGNKELIVTCIDKADISENTFATPGKICNEDVLESEVSLLDLDKPTCIESPLGIVSWWPGDGTADDIKGQNKGVLKKGVGFAQGKVGQGFYFDKQEMHVETGTNDLLFGTGDFTIEGWVKTSSSTDQAIFSFDKYNPAAYVTKSGILSFWLSGKKIGTSSPNSYYTDGIFHHLAFVRKNGKLILYGDGKEDTILFFGDTILNRNKFLIGWDQYGGDEFKGVIDELTVYNRALSPEEIKRIYEASSAGKCKGTCPSIGASCAQDPQPQCNQKCCDGKIKEGSCPPLQKAAKGWNFLHLPKMKINDLPAVFFSIQSDGTWQRITSNEIEAGVYFFDADEFSFSAVQLPSKITIKKGWNAVALPNTENMDVIIGTQKKSLAEAMQTNLISLYAFDNGWQKVEKAEAGKAYLVKAADAGEISPLQYAEKIKN